MDRHLIWLSVITDGQSMLRFWLLQKGLVTQCKRESVRVVLHIEK